MNVTIVANCPLCKKSSAIEACVDSSSISNHLTGWKLLECHNGEKWIQSWACSECVSLYNKLKEQNRTVLTNFLKGV